jgi:membrane protease YdiL (CAAX protease family)
LEASPTPVPTTTWRLADFVRVLVGGVLAGVLAAVLTAEVPDAQVPAALIAQYGGHLLAARFVVRRKGKTLADLGLDIKPGDAAYLALGSLLQFALAAAFYPLAVALGLEENTQAIDEQVSVVTGLAGRAALLLGLCLLGPLAEEVMFRGLLMRWMAERRTGRFALIASAAVFASFHILGVSTEEPLRAALLVVPQAFLLGLMVGRLTQRSGRLGSAVFTHAGFNLVGALALMAAGTT